MKKLFPLLILSVLFLCSCNQDDQWALHPEKKTAAQAFARVPADFIPRKLTVLSAGDSLTQGIGDSTNQGGYLPYLETMLEKEKGIKEVDFYNYGVKGNRTTQLLKRLKTPEMKAVIQKSDIVILTIGGNDIMKVVKDNIENLLGSSLERELPKVEATGKYRLKLMLPYGVVRERNIRLAARKLADFVEATKPYLSELGVI